mgnify:CR=1 FL=1
MKDKSSQETDQAPPPAESEQQPQTPKNGVFIMRAKGHTFEEFKKICIDRFREAGLLADEPPPSRKRRRLDGG